MGDAMPCQKDHLFIAIQAIDEGPGGFTVGRLLDEPTGDCKATQGSKPGTTDDRDLCHGLTAKIPSAFRR